MEYKASVTVFFSLTTLMVISLIFSLVEVVHYTAVGNNTDVVSKIGVESAFAQYNRMLWDEYKILAFDAGFGRAQLNTQKVEANVGEYILDNINPEKKGQNYLRAYPSQVSLSEYGLLTDNGGAAFICEAAKAGKSGILNMGIDTIRSLAGSAESNTKMSADDLLREAKEGLKEAESELAENEVSPEQASVVIPKEEISENPVDTAMSWKSKAVLSQVIKDMNSISTSTVNGSLLPSKRPVNKGNYNEPADANAADKMFCGLYLRDRFSSYRNDRQHDGLKYEWEYVLNGKASDDKNLEATVSKIIGLREAENIAAIIADGTKMAEALGIASAICVLVPFLIEPVKWGIIAAWAYLESVLDVRLLLSGGKVAVVKTPVQWTSNVLAFPSYVDPGVTAKNCEAGLSYEDYLLLITLLVSERDLGMRSLDILEIALRSNEDYRDCHIDNFIYGGVFDITYNANPIFASVIPMLSGKLDTYEFKRKEGLSYL